MKSIILFIIFICCLIFTSFIKNNTRFVEKKIAILNQDIKILEKELIETKLEYEYITTPEYLSVLSSNYLFKNLVNYNHCMAIVESLFKSKDVCSNRKKQ